MLRLVLTFLFLAIAPAAVQPAQAQGTEAQVWIQIEAKPRLPEAEERAQAWQTMFDNVQGFVLTSGWHVITLGPFSREDATARLADLKRENLVPADSFISDGSGFREGFWPVGAIT